MNEQLLAIAEKQLCKRIGFRKHIAHLMEGNEKEMKKLVKRISDYKHPPAE